MTNKFTFGKNWKEFTTKHLTQKQIEISKKSLTSFYKIKDLKGKSFLDIGCGSGMFSLAAINLHASKVTSIDIDPESVNCCRKFWKQLQKPNYWKIKRASILNRDYIKSLGKYDFVYAWGVLHHTGKMWQAIDNTCLTIKKNGLLYLAIYNKEDNICIYKDGRFGTSYFWLKIKKIYKNSHFIARMFVDYILEFILIISYLIRFKNPRIEIENHNNLRGMSWKTDIKDWMGGYPYEFAQTDEIFNYLYNKGFNLKHLKCGNGLRNNEYLFIKK